MMNGSAGISRTGRNNRRESSNKSISLFAVAKAFALGIVFGLLFLLISPEPDYDYEEAAVQSSNGGKPKLTFSSKVQSLFSLTTEPTWAPSKSPTNFPTPYPTNFPTTPAPTVYGCKSKLETPSWVTNLNQDSQIKYDGDLKFYIDPQFDSRPLIACFFEQLQVPKAKEWCSEESDWECAVKLSDIQHLPSFASEFDHILQDIAIIEGFRNHKNRVYDSTEAHLIIVDFIPTLSRSMPEDMSFFEGKCHESVLSSHNERGGQVAKVLQQSPLWRRQHGTDHVFIMSSPIAANTARATLSDELHRFLAEEKKPPIFLTNSASAVGLKQKYSSQSGESKKRAKYALDVPQILSGFIHQTQPEAQSKGMKIKFSNGIKPPHERKYAIYMEETFPKVKGSLEVFKTVAEVLHQKGENVFVNLRKRQRTFLRVEASHAQMMADSKFCLLFSDVDDTEGKNRLYDALATGCIPFFVQNEDNPKPEAGAQPIRLPFKGQIDWKRIGYYFSSISCLDEHMIDTIRYLQEVIETSKSDVGMQELINMQQYGLKVYEKLRLPNTIPDYRLNMRFKDSKSMKRDEDTDVKQQDTDEVKRDKDADVKQQDTDEANSGLIVDANHTTGNDDLGRRMLGDEVRDYDADNVEIEKSDGLEYESNKEEPPNTHGEEDEPIEEKKVEGEEMMEEISNGENIIEKTVTQPNPQRFSTIPDSLYANEYEKGVIQSILIEIEQKPRYNLN